MVGFRMIVSGDRGTPPLKISDTSLVLKPRISVRVFDRKWAQASSRLHLRALCERLLTAVLLQKNTIRFLSARKIREISGVVDSQVSGPTRGGSVVNRCLKILIAKLHNLSS